MTVQTVETVGFSVEERAIECHRFGPEGMPLDTLFIGVVHGDEGISGELMFCWIDALKRSSGMRQAIAVVPVLNPDGLKRGTRVNANGVDLNRNFPTATWQATSGSPEYCPGKAPGSEPETQVVMNLVETLKPAKIVTVHSPYRVVNFDGPARWLAEAMAKHNGYPVTEDIGYPTPGSFGTYAGVERNIPVVTLELPEDEPIETVWRDNEAALWAVLDATQPN